MTMIKPTIKTALTLTATATLLAIASPATPALAGGSIAYYLTPRSASEAQMMDFGLRAYGLYKGLRGGGARIDQNGQDNSAGVAQDGGGNVGIIGQHGNGHAARLEQAGNGNSYGIFQYGRNTNADVVQQGDGGTGATFTYGW